MKTLVSTLLLMKAQIEAQKIMIELLARKSGADIVEFRKVYKETTAACVQKFLELAEDQNPAMAAQLDRRAEAPEFDEEIYDMLNLNPFEYDDEPRDQQ